MSRGMVSMICSEIHRSRRRSVFRRATSSGVRSTPCSVANSTILDSWRMSHAAAIANITSFVSGRNPSSVRVGWSLAALSVRRSDRDP